jgi:SAM-dependent methyltransferase
VWPALAATFVLSLACVTGAFVWSTRRAEYWAKVDCPGRESRPLEQIVLAEGHVRPGMSVADIGAGGGFFTFRFARAVGHRGRVVATEIDPHMIEQLHLERSRQRTWNVFPSLVSRDQVGLERASFDLVLIINTYQFPDCTMGRNRGYLRELALTLRPGGRVIIADDFVHTPGWASEHQPQPSPCGNLRPAELAALAAPYLPTQRIIPLVHPAYRYVPHEEPGYVMILQSAPAGATP